MNFLNKELSHRSHELKLLGWNQDDISRYEELWEYTQRWGLINLERDDRQFLKKAQKLIPKPQPKKTSTKKSIEEKSYYLWLDFYLEEIKNFDKKNLSEGEISVWQILLEEELELLKKYKPVMGLPDTLKAKELYKSRKNILEESVKKYNCKESRKLFDFDVVINTANENKKKSWKSLIENSKDDKNHYPILKINEHLKLRNFVRQQIEEFMITNYSSLKENL